MYSARHISNVTGGKGVYCTSYIPCYWWERCISHVIYPMLLVGKVYIARHISHVTGGKGVYRTSYIPCYWWERCRAHVFRQKSEILKYILSVKKRPKVIPVVYINIPSCNSSLPSLPDNRKQNVFNASLNKIFTFLHCHITVNKMC